MASDVDFSGKLSFLNLGELLQLLGSSSATGTLRVFSSKPDPGLIMLDKGTPINAANGALSGLDALFPSLAGPTAASSSPTKRPPASAPSKKAGWRSSWTACGCSTRARSRSWGPRAGWRRRGWAQAAGTAPQRPAAADQGASGRLLLRHRRGGVLRRGRDRARRLARELDLGHPGRCGRNRQEHARRAAQAAAGGGWRFSGQPGLAYGGDNMRSTTVTASGNTQLGMLDSQLLAGELANLSPLTSKP